MQADIINFSDIKIEKFDTMKMLCIKPDENYTPLETKSVCKYFF